jgi:hypothetical protein
VIYLGQHSATNIPLPKVEEPDVLTTPQDSFAHYVSFITQGLNAWRERDPFNREEVYLNSDARNYLKMRDLKYPLQHPILTLFNFEHAVKHWQYSDTRPMDPRWAPCVKESSPDVWRGRVKNVYSRLEVCGVLPGAPLGDMLTYDENWADRKHFGMLINEARAYVREELQRAYIVANYVKPLVPHWIHGVWSEESLAKLEMDIKPVRFDRFNDLYHSVRTTFTTPSSGSGWATTKPWEAFACGTVCFFHKYYDTQDNILADAPEELRSYLRVGSPADLMVKVIDMNQNHEKWLRMIRMQREHFDHAVNERRYLKMIEDRIWR